MVRQILCIVVLGFQLAFFLRIALSFFPVRPGSPTIPVREVTFTITEPLLSRLRSVLPPLQGAMAGFGVAEIATFILLMLVTAILQCG